MPKLFNNTVDIGFNPMNYNNFTRDALKGSIKPSQIKPKTNLFAKFDKALDTVNKVAAPVQAGLSVVGLGFDIANSIKAQKLAKEQLELSKKNFNLELEKSQKQELAYNKLGATVDKAFGGSGKIENTIDYSQYQTDATGGNSLVSGGAGGGSIGGDVSSSGNGINVSPKVIPFSGYSQTLEDNNS